MSDATGIVIDKETGEALAYFIYGGTADVVLPTLHETAHQAWDGRESEEWGTCACKAKPQRVWLYSDYGGGFYWPGEVCLVCRRITSGHDAWGQTGWPRDNLPPRTAPALVLQYRRRPRFDRR